MSHNNLVCLPNEVAEIRQLSSFDLSHNQLTSLPDSLCSLTDLIELDISHNQLSQHFELPNIQVLKASNNCFSTLPISASSSTNLREINVSHNQIDTLGIIKEDLMMLPWLQEIDLRDNPLSEELRSSLMSVVRVKILLED